MLWVGVVGLVAAAAAVLFLVPVPTTTHGASKEAGAAFLGLILIVVAVLGPDWRDWF